MSQTPPTRRRWFQFSLGTMLWLMLTTALAVYGFSEHRKRVLAEGAAKLSLDMLNRATADFESLIKMQDDSNRLLREAEKIQAETDASATPN